MLQVAPSAPLRSRTRSATRLFVSNSYRSRPSPPVTLGLPEMTRMPNVRRRPEDGKWPICVLGVAGLPNLGSGPEDDARHGRRPPGEVQAMRQLARPMSASDQIDRGPALVPGRHRYSKALSPRSIGVAAHAGHVRYAAGAGYFRCAPASSGRRSALRRRPAPMRWTNVTRRGSRATAS